MTGTTGRASNDEILRESRSSARQSLAPKSLVESMGASSITKAVEILLMVEELAPPEKYYRFIGFHIQLSEYNTEKYLKRNPSILLRILKDYYQEY